MRETKEGFKGITLIALVITIILLLILSGITITQLTQNGLFGNAKIAKEITRYRTAKEIVELKLMEIETECIRIDEDYTLVKVADGMKAAKDITTQNYYYKKTSKEKDGLNRESSELEGVAVSVDEYKEYIFLIGKITDSEKIEITGVTTGEIADTIASFKSVEEFEKEIFGYIKTNENKITSMEEMLKQCGIDTSYNIEDIANNKEGSLEKILKNEEAIEYILDNKNNYIDKLVESEEAMTLLGKNSKVIDNVVNSDELCEKIANSEYRENFSEYITYNQGTLIGTAGGRTYNKLNNGFSLAGSFVLYGDGANFILVGKSYDDVLGYCSYDSSYIQPPIEFEYEGEKWYSAIIAYGLADGQVVTSSDNSKYLGIMNGVDGTGNITTENIAIYMLNDFYGKVLIPTMTSNSQYGITVSTSDSYDGDNYAYYACDKMNDVFWNTESGNYNPHWFQIEFEEPKIANAYTLCGAYSYGVQYKFYLEASNDGVTWTNLEDTIHEGLVTGLNFYSINLRNSIAYKYYRVYFPEGGWAYGSSGAVTIYNFNLYGK